MEIENGNIIWIDNLETWPEGYCPGDDNSKIININGIVIERYDKPVFIYRDGEEIQSGIPVPEGTNLREASHRFLLKDVKWEILKD